MTGTGSGETKAEYPGGGARPAPARSLQRCLRHPAADAAARCDRCGRRWCDSCVRHGRERGVTWLACECGGRCSAIESPAPPPASAEKRIADAFTYPLRGEGRWLLAAGTLFYAVIDLYLGTGARGIARTVAETVAAPNGGRSRATDSLDVVVAITALVLVLLAFGCQLAWVLRVIRESVRGRDELPGFPDFVTFDESVLVPLGQGLALLAVTLGPGAALLPWGAAGAAAGAMLLLGGAAVLPMALLSVAIAGSLEGLDLRRILRSIPRIGAPYSFAAALFAAVVGLLAFGAWFLEGVPYAGPFVRAFLVLHLSAVAGRVLGLLYARNAGRLGWY